MFMNRYFLSESSEACLSPLTMFVMFLAFLMVLSMAVGCGSIQVTPINQVPPGCENSLIYANIPAPDIVDTGLKVAMVQVAKMGYKKEVMLLFNNCLHFLPDENDPVISMTGAEFVNFALVNVKSLNRYAGVELVIVMSSLNKIRLEVPLDRCDVRLIRRHLEDELIYVGMIPDDEEE